MLRAEDNRSLTESSVGTETGEFCTGSGCRFCSPRNCRKQTARRKKIIVMGGELLAFHDPNTGETPAVLVFVDGKKFRTLREPNIATEFKAMVIDYIDQRYGAGDKVPASAVTAAE
jgi:hypothetical protein